MPRLPLKQLQPQAQARSKSGGAARRSAGDGSTAVTAAGAVKPRQKLEAAAALLDELLQKAGAKGGQEAEEDHCARLQACRVLWPSPSKTLLFPLKAGWGAHGET